MRLVGGSGDRGADVLGAKDGDLWVLQCKHTTTTGPPSAAVSEVVEAARYYRAQRMVVVTSRPPGDAFNEERLRFERTGLKVEVADPAVLTSLISESPEYPPSRRTLFDYQTDVAGRLREAGLDTGRAQAVMATGLGKTVVMAELVAVSSGTTWWSMGA